MSIPNTRLCEIVFVVSSTPMLDFHAHKSIAKLYRCFDAPISVLDCGQECAPYNENGEPFCCDTQHSIPAAYTAEWEYLQIHTNLWHRWQPEDAELGEALRQQTPDNMLLVECRGYAYCQRPYRTITCRAFPFFPYINGAGEFLGLSYYWVYEDRCWVISHLDCISAEYRQQFIKTFEALLVAYPAEINNFAAYSAEMRQIFVQRRRAIPLLHRNGNAYKITPANERMRRCDPADFRQYEPYAIAAQLRFPDEHV